MQCIDLIPEHANLLTDNLQYGEVSCRHDNSRLSALLLPDGLQHQPRTNREKEDRKTAKNKMQKSTFENRYNWSPNNYFLILIPLVL